jgi:PHD/YefM family antitoxin component YafN of YafNO toxin-antitoxin module
MKNLNLEDVQDNFDQLFDDVLPSGEPLKITRDTGNVVLVSEEVWNGVAETLNLVSISGMREALVAAEEVMDENRTLLRALA